MIRAKLLLMEYDIMNNPFKSNKKLKAIKAIKNLLKVIDFDVEIIPLDSETRLNKLLAKIKEHSLNNDESAIVSQLIDS